MSELAERVSGLVETLVLPLVEHKVELEVTATEDAAGVIYVDIACNEADTGKIIGRQGRAIKAVRTLARAVVPASSKTRVEVELID